MTFSPYARKRKRQLVARKRRGVEFLEFAIVLPIFIIFLLFTVDMARLAILQAGLQDATQQLARGGAQIGGWGGRCPNATTTCHGVPVAAFQNDVTNMPLGATSSIGSILSWTTTADGTPASGQGPVAGTWCGPNAPYVVAYTTYNPHDFFITPLLNDTLHLLVPGWHLSAHAVARCEIAR